ncbi:MAG: hypothetical protein QXL18_05170 [Candidatus Woesearchaeota archaeon]
MMITKLEFIFVYSIFFLFIVYISSLAGITIFTNVEEIQNIPNSLDVLNPFVSIPYFFKFLQISSEYRALFTILIIPFLIGIAWVILEWARGI